MVGLYFPIKVLYPSTVTKVKCNLYLFTKALNKLNNHYFLLSTNTKMLIAKPFCFVYE